MLCCNIYPTWRSFSHLATSFLPSFPPGFFLWFCFSSFCVISLRWLLNIKRGNQTLNLSYFYSVRQFFFFFFFFATGSLVRDGRNFYPIKLLFRSLEVRSTKYLLLCNCKNRHKFTFVEFNSDIYTIALFFFFFF